MNVSDQRNPLTVGLMAMIATVLLAGLSACSNAQVGSQEETTSEEASVDWEAVGQAIGKEGENMDGGVYRVNMPRSDLSVTSQDVDIKPGLALGSYAAFKETGENEALVMGDLVLTEDEYDEVISQLQEGGIEQTAIHKHLLEESPAIWWTHIEGRGEPVEMAEAVNAALQLTGTPLSESGGGSEEVDFNTEQLDETIGHTGKTEGGIYKYSIGRGESVTTEDGTELPPGMGVATALNFQPTGDGQAAINGDFVMTEDEVNPVIRALRDNGIEVVALHNHHLMEEPRLFYMHFWANDDAETLAQGLRAALDETNSA
ncbi:MAG: DUF1259 domain-containing protein [Actinobacteria bacterium]|nr:DUF1259 domain-containing protein [Actinomycetota bacterium]